MCAFYLPRLFWYYKNWLWLYVAFTYCYNIHVNTNIIFLIYFLLSIHISTYTYTYTSTYTYIEHQISRNSAFNCVFFVLKYYWLLFWVANEMCSRTACYSITTLLYLDDRNAVYAILESPINEWWTLSITASVIYTIVIQIPFFDRLIMCWFIINTIIISQSTYPAI